MSTHIKGKILVQEEKNLSFVNILLWNDFVAREVKMKSQLLSLFVKKKWRNNGGIRSYQFIMHPPQKSPDNRV